LGTYRTVLALKDCFSRLWAKAPEEVNFKQQVLVDQLIELQAGDQAKH
jgi:hypothetical protein